MILSLKDKERTSPNSLDLTKRLDWLHSGAPVGARTQNAAVGGRDFIQLDYKRIDEIITFSDDIDNPF